MTLMITIKVAEVRQSVKIVINKGSLPFPSFGKSWDFAPTSCPPSHDDDDGPSPPVEKSKSADPRDLVVRQNQVGRRGRDARRDFLVTMT